MKIERKFLPASRQAVFNREKYFGQSKECKSNRKMLPLGFADLHYKTSNIADYSIRLYGFL